MSKSVLNADRTPRLLQPDDAVLLQPKGSYFSELIQNVFARDYDMECKPVLFTSPRPGAGVSLVCSYVATELAGQGGRVLLAEVQALRALARRPAHDRWRPEVPRLPLLRHWIAYANSLRSFSWMRPLYRCRTTRCLLRQPYTALCWSRRWGRRPSGICSTPNSSLNRSVAAFLVRSTPRGRVCPR